MKKKPRDPKESFFARGAGVRALIGGTLIGILTLAAFYFGLNEFGYSLRSNDIPEDIITYARTMAFVVLAGSQLFFSLSMRSLHKSVFRIGLFSNLYLVGAVILGFILQLGVIAIPIVANAFKVRNLSVSDWWLVLLFSLVPFVLNEVSKLFMSETE